MPEDLTALPPETFFRLAVERGGLDLESVIQSLSPEAADALRRIAAPPSLLPKEGVRSAPMRGVMRSVETGDTLDPPTTGSPICPSCGRVNHSQDNYCRSCGRQLSRATPPPVTLDSLVAQGRLSPEQANAALNALAHLQSEYTAGTRYSVFGADS